jgi:cytoskeletal protein RodZ
MFEAEKFIEEITPAEEVGSLFKEARIEAGESHEDVSKKTNIRKCYIKDIENGDLGYLPGDIYKTGFLQIYARHLKLDGDEVLRRLSIEPLDANNLNESIPGIVSDSNSMLPNKWVIISSTILAIIILIYFYS